jgi:esterase/lipase superfamily enzyme
VPVKTADPCISNNTCTAVSVFFGTNRAQKDLADRVGFSAERTDRLQLGQSIVTVPKGVNRKRGEVVRPTWFEVTLLRIPPAGEPAKHFTIPANGIELFESTDGFLRAVHAYKADAGEFKDHAFVFVHGYRVSFDDALYRTAQIAYDLGDDDGPFGTAFLYSWPSGGDVKDYQHDFDSARLAVPSLKTFLELVLGRTEAKYVHLIGHSMGTWPLLTALEQVVRPAENPPVQQVILAAPDIDAVEFKKMAEKITSVARGLTLYVSSTDLAMRASRELHRGIPRAGDVTSHGPVIVKGIDTIDISQLSTDVFSLGHATYADRRELLNDIGLLLRKGERPPNRRTPIYRQMRLQDLVYWRYPE